MKIIGVYGSLKKGCYNYERFGLNSAKYLGQSTLTGPMYLIAGQYPALFPATDTSLDSVHPIEIYEVSDRLFDILDSMERGAGYYQADVIIDPMWHPDELMVNVWFGGPDIAVSASNYIEHYPV